MDPAEAEELKQLLRKLAAKQKPPLDLRVAENRYTIWPYSEPQRSYAFGGSARDEATVYSKIPCFLGDAVAILEVSKSGDRVRLWTCEVG
jgi:hypothetical protein